MKIKSSAEIAKKWAQVTPARARQWEEEVRATPDETWAGAAIAGAPNYDQGVSQAIADGRFAKGVEANRTKWKRKALAVGPARFGTGVRAAEPDMAQGYAPYREIISAMELTPKGPRGAPGNYDRVRQIGEALHDARVGT